MSIKIIHAISEPAQSFWSSTAEPFGYAYFVLTAVLTIISNFLMTARLLVARRQYMQAMGKSTGSIRGQIMLNALHREYVTRQTLPQHSCNVG
jgi:hypothetical protein